MTKFLCVLIFFGAIHSQALTVERSLPVDGWFNINLSHIPTSEQVAAVRIRILLKPGAAISSLNLSPGSDGIWSQIPPEIRRDGQALEIIALAPNHAQLSTSQPLYIFKLDLKLVNSMDSTPIDSIQVLETLDTKARPLKLAILLTDIATGIKASAVDGAEVHTRRMDRVHEIDFFLVKPLNVHAKVIDPRGRVIRVLQNGKLDPGRHRLRWDGRDESTGLVVAGNYILDLKIGPNTYHKLMRHAL